MKKIIFNNLIFLVTIILFASWGSTGHKIINQNSGMSFNSQMMQLISWIPTITSHASDADYRKDTDQNEAPKHYIDIDSYQIFVSSKQLIQDWDSIVSLFGYSTVIDNGILPWATVATVDTLSNCFARKDWAKAVLTAADLGHYVGDGHMPLHITENFNGQNTGNTGIHSRYETTMISKYSNQIIYAGDTNLNVIQDVNQYVFNYIYNNYKYVDSVLLADNDAKSAAGNTTSNTYYLNLWNKTGIFTIELFKNASHVLAELIYTAWVKAGSPEIDNTAVNELLNRNKIMSFSASPNPFNNEINFHFDILENSMNEKNVSIEIFNLSGEKVDVIRINNISKGQNSVNYHVMKPSIKSGIYIAELKYGNSNKKIKIISHK